MQVPVLHSPDSGTPGVRGEGAKVRFQGSGIRVYRLNSLNRKCPPP